MKVGMVLGSQRGGRGTKAEGVDRDAGLGQGRAWCHHRVCPLCTLPHVCKEAACKGATCSPQAYNHAEILELN